MFWRIYNVIGSPDNYQQIAATTAKYIIEYFKDPATYFTATHDFDITAMFEELNLGKLFI